MHRQIEEIHLVSQEEDHDELVAALQDVMLPAGIPVLPHLDLAARYCLPGGAEEAIGNWFDVVTLTGGRVGLVVGEAVGSGMAAAAAMGQVRAVLRASLERDEDVVSALELADTFAHTSSDARGTAVVLAVVDRQAGSVVHATAGHPAPVVTAAGSSPAHDLDRTATGWLGTGSTYTAVRSDLGPGDLLLLTCAAPHRAVASVAAIVDDQLDAGDVENTLDRLTSNLFTQRDEALTLLAAEVRPQPRPTFSLDLPVGELSMRTGRERLTTWLDEISAPPMDALAIVHATAELVANAVEHAHGGGDGATPSELGAPEHLEIRGELTSAGEVRVEVADRGTWRESSDDDMSRGRGLAMAAGLVDSLRIRSDGDGTRAVLHHRLCRPVHIDHGPGGTTALPNRSVAVTREVPGAVSLRGDFGHDDVDRVSAELLLASRGGTRPVTVDLAQVTHLASTAIRMLGDLVADEAASVVTLRAPADTAAQRALDIASVPHDAA